MAKSVVKSVKVSTGRRITVPYSLIQRSRSRSESLRPGEYEVTVTLQSRYRVGIDDGETEDELIALCRKQGEMVDWECNKV